MTRKQIEYVILSALLLGGSLYGIDTYYVQKKWDSIAVLEQEVKQQSALDISFEQRTAKVKQFEQQKKQIQDQINAIDQQIPLAREIPQLIEFFYQVTALYQVSGDKIQLGGGDDSSSSAKTDNQVQGSDQLPQIETTGKLPDLGSVIKSVAGAGGNGHTSQSQAGSAPYPSISLQITYTGAPQNILKLLDELPAKISRKITLDQTTLSYQKDGKMSLSLKASIYYQSGSHLDFEKMPKEYPIGDRGYKNLTDIFNFQIQGDGQASTGTNQGNTPAGVQGGSNLNATQGKQSLGTVIQGPFNDPSASAVPAPAADAFANQTVTVKVPPLQQNRTTFVALRDVIEKLGGTIDYQYVNPKNIQQGMYEWIDLGRIHAMFQSGSTDVVLNNRMLSITAPLTSYQNRAYISVADLQTILQHPISYQLNSDQSITLTVR